jgi:hypothetical protein
MMQGRNPASAMDDERRVSVRNGRHTAADSSVLGACGLACNHRRLETRPMVFAGAFPSSSAVRRERDSSCTQVDPCSGKCISQGGAKITD